MNRKHCLGGLGVVCLPSVLEAMGLILSQFTPETLKLLGTAYPPSMQYLEERVMIGWLVVRMMCDDCWVACLLAGFASVI